MPIFQYLCECGHISEEITKDDIEMLECQKCGRPSHKIISKTNWIINGSCYNHLAPAETKESLTEEKKISKKILVDLYCNKCKKVYENEFIYTDAEIDKKCDECDTILNRIFSYASFELKYNPKTDICDWSGNTSQYWKDVKESRRQGKKVKGANEV